MNHFPNILVFLVAFFLSPTNFLSTTISSGTSTNAYAVIVVVDAMRIVVQRVKSASVTTTENNVMVSQIGPGIVALIGIHVDDNIHDIQHCCQHLLQCKLWNHPTTNKPWKRSIIQMQYECLLVSQFTLYGTTNKKSSYTPDYKYAMKSIPAQEIYNTFVQMIQSQIPTKVQTGVFGQMMDVALINDGPLTIIIESRNETPATSNTDSNDTNIDHNTSSDSMKPNSTNTI